jgi:maltose O-acetyltransferase
MLRLAIRAYGMLERWLGRVANRTRLARLRMQGAQIGQGVRVFGRFDLVGDARNLRIGAGSTINVGVLFNVRERIDIGSGVHLSAGAQLHTARLRTPIGDGEHVSAPIVLGDGVWLGAGCVVGAGVRIGDGSVIGANSVVLSDIGPGLLAAGMPARPIRPLASA